MATTAAERHLHIGELAARVGVNPKTIRYYEELGLLPEAERTAAGYRLYGQVDADRLDFIRRVQRLGFSLGEIGEILALRDRGERPCRYVTERLEHRAREIDRQIADLERLKLELVDLRARARSVPPSESSDGGFCHLLER